MNLMIEYCNAAEAFCQMLDPNYVPDNNNNLVIDENNLEARRVQVNELNTRLGRLNKKNEDLLKDKKVPLEKIGKYTRLMLYAAYNISDERFKSELNNADFDTIEGFTSDDGWKINALTFADDDTYRLLLESKKFSKRSVEASIYYAVFTEATQKILCAAEMGHDLFFRTFGSTPLILACENGLEKVVKCILATNPTEEQISIINPNNLFTAYLSAQDSGSESCCKLLENYHSSRHTFLNFGLNINQLKEVRQLLNRGKNDKKFDANLEKRSYNLLVGCGDSRDTSSLVCAYHSNNSKMVGYVEDYFDVLSLQEKINTLIVTIQGLTSKEIVTFTNEIDGLDIKINTLYQRLEKLYAEFIEHQERDIENWSKTIETLSFPQATDEKLWDIIKRLIANSAITKIQSACPTAVDNIEGAIHVSNYRAEDSVKFVSLLTENTTVVESDVVMDISHKPVTDLLELIMGRNRQIAETISELTKNRVYNMWVKEINRLITAIYKNKNINADEKSLPKIQPKSCPTSKYSLKELCAFTLNYGGNEGSSMIDSGEKSKPSEDIVEIIDNTRLPKSEETLYRVFCASKNPFRFQSVIPERFKAPVNHQRVGNIPFKKEESIGGESVDCDMSSRFKT